MEKFELTDQNCKSFMVWLDNSGLSWNTKRNYRCFMKRLQKDIGYISKETMPKIMKLCKHQNQRAVLYAINRYCFENDIDFQIIIQRVKAKKRSLPQIPGTEEIKTLIDSVDPIQSLMIRCIFNMGAGLRASEVLKMCWNHIRWAEWINNKDSFGKIIIKDGKGDKDRIVNIPPKLMMDLFKLAEQREIINEFGIPDAGMIFKMGASGWRDDLRKENEQEWRDQYILHAYDIFQYNFEKACIKILGRKINIHSLRHCRATYLYEVEHVPIERIQGLLGHSSLDTTMIYTKINPTSTFELMKNTKEL